MILKSSNQPRFSMLAVLAAASLLGCASEPPPGTGQGDPSLPGIPGPSDPGKPNPDDPLPQPSSVCSTAPACNSSITVDPNGPALLVTDAAALAEFPLEKVVGQILEFQGASTTPLEMMQRLFDTMNTSKTGKFPEVFHCDSNDNGQLGFMGGDSFSCPRAEGALAESEGFFKAGDPDSFIPVALVNRFDLTPVDGSRCGQYRIIYAKTSGLTNPDNRVFLIFEAALPSPMPGCLESCRPVADFWKGLEGKSSKDIAAGLKSFYFDGLSGFKPAIHPLSYGLGIQSQGYGGSEPGQIRVSMHMQDPWDMQELHIEQDPVSGQPFFLQQTVKNNPPALLFDPTADVQGFGTAFRQQFLWNELISLSGKQLKDVQMFTNPQFNGVESRLAGDLKTDYLASASKQGGEDFLGNITQQMIASNIGADCPAGDPLDAAAVVKRANVLSCAGCHSPKAFLGESRSIGCGLTWPDTLGQSHVTEKKELSPALKEVFLPRRAEVLATFLQACDLDAIQANLQKNPQGGGDFKDDAPPVMPVPTLGGSSTH